ncbi:MAG: PEP-CTERM sorting domain-containing protein [Vicinamibacteria bacterium]
MTKRVLAGIAVAASLMSGSAYAVPFAFDFESVPATGGNAGGYTSLPLTSGNVSATLTRSSGTAFDVVSNTGGQSGKPAGWGLHSLSPFFNTSVAGDAWLLTFSVPVLSLSIQFGDYGADNDSPVGLGAFSGPNGTGVNVANSTTGWGTGLSFSSPQHFKTLTVSSPYAFQSVQFSSSGPFPNSLFWDNIQGQAVPEPGTLLLVGSGITALALRRRRKA